MNIKFNKKGKVLFVSLKIALFYIICGVSIFSFGQSAIDSLSNKSYNELIADYRNAFSLKTKEACIRIILERAEKEKDTSHLITGHHLAALTYSDERSALHCDSIIIIAKEKPTKYYPASGYLIRGNYYYNNNDLKKALDDYLLVNAYARDYFNEEFLMESNYYVGILKNRIGEHNEALKLHLENYKRLKLETTKVSDTDYLTYVFAVAHTYNELQKIDSASYFNVLGIRESLKRNKHTKYLHFVLNEGVTQFYDQRYLRALDSLNKALPHFEEIKDAQNCAIGYFYAGKSYLYMQDDSKAMNMFQKIDSIFVENNYIHPKLRSTYEILFNHYKEKNDVDQQLSYITRLISLDSIHSDSEIYINRKIIKEYDTPNLIIEKENIINTLKDSKNKSLYIIMFLSALLVMSLAGLYFLYNRRKKDKINFLKLLNQKEKNNLKLRQTKKIAELNISPDIVEKILANLDDFESERDYLKQGTNLNELSKKFNTNSNYLSKIINNYKKSSFINYLNNLRIDFAVDQLKTDEKFRNYTISAIANDVGFSNTQSFSKAFLKKTGIKPSYFIRELEKLDK